MRLENLARIGQLEAIQIVSDSVAGGVIKHAEYLLEPAAARWP